MSLRLSLPRLTATAAVPRPRRSNVPDFAVNPKAPHVDLVGPPDPISNIRPIIYKVTPNAPRPTPSYTSPSPSSSSSASSSRTPLPSRLTPSQGSLHYSPGEFPREGDETAGQAAYRVQREKLDKFNNDFWASNNIRFAAALSEAMASLPPMSTPPTQAEEDRKEDRLAEFYKSWLIQEEPKQKQWMKDWWKGNWGILKSWAFGAA
ncbi:hypothetical protein BDY24DRAFT_418904 [Mrakia frigida]|uniref:uncharacterized protein n=1 Tax=Mrakia frigida TaxID=29902 RepID=UPI003FCC04E2